MSARPAAQNEQIRSCIGMSIVYVNNGMPIDTLQDFKDFTTESTEIELVFRRKTDKQQPMKENVKEGVQTSSSSVQGSVRSSASSRERRIGRVAMSNASSREYLHVCSWSFSARHSLWRAHG